MGIVLSFNDEFGVHKELSVKNFNKIHINVHPEFIGIHLCYLEAFKSLKTSLSIFSSLPEIQVWKDSKLQGYCIASKFSSYLYWSEITPQSIKLLVHSFPQDEEKVELLKNAASTEFLDFLSSFHHDLNLMNPIKLQTLINRHISPKAILALNKKYSNKPHSEISLEQLATLLSCSRNQLNYRNKNIYRERQNVLDQLEKSEAIVYQLLNNTDFTLTLDQFWK
ncbi:hypothetical protein [Acinetobacter sp. NEB 394]|uniref:hypothetical protein n=1 Tax=Acinetobacter sp. NEB 394 TaxID=2743575 RepID=UPI0015963EC6|nr:hypothetical protein [Acinetobacter sp. NEB 394]QKY89406.1 hypothetical protein HUK62_01840 [Acinetobacter sp. NEB 394]